MPSEIETVVFDTEPIIAYFQDASGSDVVEDYIEVLHKNVDGYISRINRTEIHYVLSRFETPDRADRILEIIDENGIRTIECKKAWREASYFKRTHAIAFGDAFALATASHVDGTLLVGAGDDFDGVTNVDIERFRTEPA